MKNEEQEKVKEDHYSYPCKKYIDFVNDKFEGYGRYNYLNGEYYIGQWSQGQKHGKGILYNANGTIKYDGLFFNDKFEG